MGGFRPIEAVASALLMPFVALLTAPIFWRFFIVPRKQELERRRSRHD